MSSHNEQIFYCGFNGFRQVPTAPEHNNTLNSFVPHGHSSSSSQNNHRKVSKPIDVAICWNYLLILDDNGITKYGLVNGKNGLERISHPPETSSSCGTPLVESSSSQESTCKQNSNKIVQISATPRHILASTEAGECWTHEENKGWRRINVGHGEKLSDNKIVSTPTTTEENEKNVLTNNEKENDSSNGGGEGEEISTVINGETKESSSSPSTALSKMVKTSCGDAHNLGLDADGLAFSLPSPLDFTPGFPSNQGQRHKVVDVVCGKEHCLLLTEHGQVYSWGGGSRGQLGHGSLNSEEKPRLITALDGLRIKKIAAGGWHSAVISQFDDLYMFGWNESGQLAQKTVNLAKPAECFSAVEKLLMACCTMQPEDDLRNPRGDTEDNEVYHKNRGEDDGHSEAEASTSIPKDSLSMSALVSGGQNRVSMDLNFDGEKDAINCYNAATASCTGKDPSSLDAVTVQASPMLIQIPGRNQEEQRALDVACGSRHTIVLGGANQLWGFGWNKYGQLGLGNNASKDCIEKIPLPKSMIGKNSRVKMLRCGDWGTAVVVEQNSPAKK